MFGWPVGLPGTSISACRRRVCGCEDVGIASIWLPVVVANGLIRLVHLQVHNLHAYSWSYCYS